MAAAETARLIASLELKDNMSKGINSAVGGIGRLESKFNRIGGIAQRGIGNAVRNIERLGIAGGLALAGAVAFGIRSLGDLARTTEQTNAVIASTGGKAGVTAAAVRDMANSLKNLSTVDDKVIQDGENMLLTFTGIGKDIFPRATKAALNMAVAMAAGNVEQVDLQASAIRLGKALNDPVKGMTALRKVGVAFTAEQIKQIKALVEAGDTVGAQTIILKELETEFGNAAAAAGKGPEASWRRLQDTGENLSQSIARGLLPVLTRASDWLSTKLADPAVVKRIDEIGAGLGRAGEQVLAFIQTVDFARIADSLGIAVGFAGNIVSAFLAMPDWVKTAVITGWGLNKLTGGAVSGIIGELGKGLIKGVLGMNAGVVNINAATVNGVPGVSAVAAKGGLGVASKVFLVGEAIGLALLVNEVRNGIADGNTKTSQAIATQTHDWLAGQPSKADLEKGLAGVEKGIADLQTSNLPLFLVQGDALDNLKKLRVEIKQQLAEALGQRLTGNLGRPGPMGLAASALAKTATTMTAIQVGLRADFAAAVAALRTASDPKAILAAAARVTKDILGGVGSAGTTKGTIADLTVKRDAALKAGDKTTAAILTAEIRKISPLVAGRAQQAALLAQGAKVVSSNESVKQKVADLKSIESTLLSEHRTTAAGIIQGLIDVVSAVKGISIPIFPVAGALVGNVHNMPGPRLTPGGLVGNVHNMPSVNVTTNVNVTAAQVTKSIVVQNRFGPSGGSREISHDLI